jgi:SAM-dependent methyltransferase
MFALPLALTLAAVVLYLRSVARMRRSLLVLRYVPSPPHAPSYSTKPIDPGLDATPSGDNNRPSTGRASYESASRLAEAELWDRYRTDLFEILASRVQSRGGCEDASDSSAIGGRRFSPDRTASAPYAVHSTLVLPVLTRRDVQAGRRIDPKRHRLPSSPFVQVSQQYSLRWLGDSTVNRIVREAIVRHLQPNTTLDVLDVGCGVGGTLYSLLPSTAAGVSPKLLRYHGVAVSEAEIFHAREFADCHLRSHRSLEGLDIRFEQQSFDAPIQRTVDENQNKTLHYSVMIAIESLAYSRNLKETLSNLLPHLRAGGILVIVDDVVLPSDAGRIAVEPGSKRPSLVTHQTWDALLRDGGCPLVEGYDLTFEYELIRGDSETLGAATAGATNEPRASSPSSFFFNPRAKMLWQYGVWWERWFASSTPAVRMIQLHDDLLELSLAARKRQEEYHVRDALSYHLYVCRKI